MHWTMHWTLILRLPLVFAGGALLKALQHQDRPLHITVQRYLLRL